MPKLRSTCLRCAVQGVTTQLVENAGWWDCPIHSADLIAENARTQLVAPDGYSFVKQPELLGKGVARSGSMA